MYSIEYMRENARFFKKKNIDNGATLASRRADTTAFYHKLYMNNFVAKPLFCHIVNGNNVRKAIFVAACWFCFAVFKMYSFEYISGGETTVGPMKVGPRWKMFSSASWVQKRCEPRFKTRARSPFSRIARARHRDASRCWTFAVLFGCILQYQVVYLCERNARTSVFTKYHENRKLKKWFLVLVHFRSERFRSSHAF